LPSRAPAWIGRRPICNARTDTHEMDRPALGDNRPLVPEGQLRAAGWNGELP
jgi:hypothetical protein